MPLNIRFQFSLVGLLLSRLENEHDEVIPYFGIGSKVSDAYIAVLDGKKRTTNTECSSCQSHNASVPDHIIST